MHEFADIERRIEHVRSLALRECDDVRLLAEIGDVLNRGYEAALQAEGRCRRLEDRIEQLMVDGDPSGRTAELVCERRTTAQAARRMRDRLARLQAEFAQVSARVHGASAAPS